MIPQFSDPSESLTLITAWQFHPWGPPTNLKVYDDGYGELYVYGNEYGPIMVIRAQTWDHAYYIAIDEAPTISPEDVPEAYGFNSEAEMLVALAKAGDNGLDLLEGYQYQSNSSGTGIVSTGDYEWQNSLEDYNAMHDRYNQIVPVFTK